MKRVIIGLGFPINNKKPSCITHDMLSHIWGACMFAPAQPYPKYIVITTENPDEEIGYVVYFEEFGGQIANVTGIHLFKETVNSLLGIDAETAFKLSANTVARSFASKGVKVVTDCCSIFEEDMWEFAKKNTGNVEIRTVTTFFTGVHLEFLIKFRKTPTPIAPPTATTPTTSSEVPECR